MRPSVRGLLAGGALFCAACEPEVGRIDMSARTTPPGAVALSEEGFEIQVGLAVGFLATVLDEGGAAMPAETTIDMTSSDSAIAGIDPSLEKDTFVLYGVTPGTTELGVMVDGVYHEAIPVVVLEQPAEP